MEVIKTMGKWNRYLSQRGERIPRLKICGPMSDVHKAYREVLAGFGGWGELEQFFDPHAKSLNLVGL